MWFDSDLCIEIGECACGPGLYFMALYGILTGLPIDLTCEQQVSPGCSLPTYLAYILLNRFSLVMFIALAEASNKIAAVYGWDYQ